MATTKIGFVGGGRMAEALIKGILEAKLFAPGDVLVFDPDGQRRDHLAALYKVSVCQSNCEVAVASSNLVLAVKPQVMAAVLEDLAGCVNENHLLISIAAGLPLVLFEERLHANHCRVIRVMPNTPALVQAGAAAISPGAGATSEDISFACRLFEKVGKAVVLEEKYLDAVTGLSGSGPAYVFSFIEALVDAGVKVGLNRQVAEELVLQTVYGSVLLAMQSNQHPAVLRAMVTSPGGTTIAGLHQLARGGFSGLVMDAVEAATRRSEELGRS